RCHRSNRSNGSSRSKRLKLSGAVERSEAIEQLEPRTLAWKFSTISPPASPLRSPRSISSTVFSDHLRNGHRCPAWSWPAGHHRPAVAGDLWDSRYICGHLARGNFLRRDVRRLDDVDLVEYPR